MEELLVSTIATSVPLLAEDGIEGRDPETWWFSSHSLGVGGVTADPVKPWLSWIEDASLSFRAVQNTSNAQIRVFRIYVYDEEGDFTRINRILRILREIIKGMAPFTHTDESGTVHRCSAAEVSGFSGNLPAPPYDGVCRFLTAQFVVSQ